MIELGSLRTDFACFLKDTTDVAATIDDCFSRIKTIQKHIFALKAFHNSLLPISQIPVEVLQDIFWEVAEAARFKEEDATRPFVGGIRGLESYPQLTLLTVCHRWREAALQSQILWNHIDHTALRGQARHFLSRSGNAPLSIYCPNYPYSFAPLDHRHRLRDLLNFHIHQATLEEYLTERNLLNTTIEMPLLETLSASRPSYARAPEDHEPLLRLRAPRLSRLYGAHLFFGELQQWCSQSANITLLDIRSVGNSRTTPVVRWVDLLDGLPRIQELYLAGAICDPHVQDWEILRTPSRRAMLPELRTMAYDLRGQSYSRTCFPQLLAHLSCRLETRIRVEYACYCIEDDLLHLRYLLSCVDIRLSAALTPFHFPLSRRYDQVRVARGLEDHRVRVTATMTEFAAMDEDLLHITLSHVHRRDGMDGVVRSLAANTSLFTDVDTIILDNIILSADTWIVLAASAHMNPTAVRVTHFTAFLAFVQALEAALQRGTSATFFPQLRSFAFAPVKAIPRVTDGPLPSATGAWPERRAGSGGRALLQRLADALAVRRQQGLGPMVVDTGAGPQDVDVHAIYAPEPDMEDDVLGLLFDI